MMKKEVRTVSEGILSQMVEFLDSELVDEMYGLF